MGTGIEKTAPYIESKESINKVMWEVAIALSPVVVTALILYGAYSLYLVFSAAFAAVLCEYPFNRKSFTRRTPLGDGSAFLAGMILGFTLSPGSPWWIPLFGSAVAILIGKQAFGGLGNNIFNPALVGRAVILIGYPALISEWRMPLVYDEVSAATPLGGWDVTYLDLFLGNTVGSIGETSALALIIGALYLFFRRYSSWRISLSYLFGAVATALLLGLDPLYTILSGSLMFGALLLSTDMITSPVARRARVVYGIGCGVLTVIIRHYTIYPEGVTFAILFMNGVTPFLDAFVIDSYFGQAVERRARRTRLAVVLAAAALLLATGFGITRLADTASAFYLDGDLRRDIRSFFPDGRYAVSFETADPSLRAEEIHSRSEMVGYIVYSSAQGFGGTLRLVTALDRERQVIGLRIADHQESPTLGGLIRRPSFLGQFLLRRAGESIHPGQVTTITGATVSSRAVARALEQALSFADPPPSDLRRGIFRDGTYTGRAGGYQGEISVEVTVTGGRIGSVDVLSHGETERLAGPAFSALTQGVLAQQTPDLDAVSGATGSSRGFLNAVRDALGRAQ